MRSNYRALETHVIGACIFICSLLAVTTNSYGGDNRIRSMVGAPGFAAVAPQEVRFTSRSQLGGKNYQIIGRVGYAPWPADLPKEEKTKRELQDAAARMGANLILDMYAVQWREASGWEWASAIAAREINSETNRVEVRHPFITAVMPFRARADSKLSKEHAALIRATVQRVLEQKQYYAFLLDEGVEQVSEQSLRTMNANAVNGLGGRDTELLAQLVEETDRVRLTIFSKADRSAVWSESASFPKRGMNIRFIRPTEQCMTKLPPSRFRRDWKLFYSGQSLEEIVRLFSDEVRLPEKPGIQLVSLLRQQLEGSGLDTEWVTTGQGWHLKHWSFREPWRMDP